VYRAICWVEEAPEPTLEVELELRNNTRARCSGCGWHRPGYDRLAERCLGFILLWGKKVFFVYAPHRVECPAYGIEVIGVDEIAWQQSHRYLTLVPTVEIPLSINGIIIDDILGEFLIRR